MDWFRLYSEFASDPKVQSMSEAMQRRLVMLLCLRCSNGLVTLHDDEIAFALRISEEELAQSKSVFIRKGFINESWEFINWDKRQYVSDSSAARVARHRSKKKAEENPVNPEVKIDETLSNVTVTPPEQNRAETEAEQIQIRTEAEQTHSTMPPSADDATGVQSPSSAVALSIQFRKNGVRTQAANPVLHKLAEQGVTSEVVQAACDEAKATKGNEPFSLGYVVAILDRWAREQSHLQAAGASPSIRQTGQKFNPTVYVNQNRVAS
ncbi:hypothetical protein KDM87_06885 [Undibacterium sp. FT147W]|uniref:Uncharacterized protein n=1 Tax=Undibacterium rivi TaxID=2828729 RepID=A0ABS5H0T5_9BURK|nr:hypothetical protein [Undibacterium rivi]MBR7792321.1 hypothetical protein [Undibacterium rivi]